MHVAIQEQRTGYGAVSMVIRMAKVHPDVIYNSFISRKIEGSSLGHFLLTGWLAGRQNLLVLKIH